MAKYRILSIDGGGIRGVIPVILLQRLMNVPGLASLLDAVDLYAGTSTGGIIALGLADKIPLDLLRHFYIEKGPEVFDDSWSDDVVDVGRLIGAEYDTRNLERELKGYFGNRTLGTLPNKVLITAFDLDNIETKKPGDVRRWKPKIFHNMPGEMQDIQQLIYKVALYTSAAPTYFPSVDGYIDGGVYANNPAMCALAQALDRRYRPNPSVDEIVLFSLGTGSTQQYIPRKRLDWGYAQWVKPLVMLMLDGTLGIADYQCRQILQDHYFRLAPNLPEGMHIDTDGVKFLPFMIDFAEHQTNLNAAVEWLKQNWL